MLGPSILDLFLDCGHCFTLKTVLLLADTYLTILETLHSKGVVHRDIKPDNLVIGAEEFSDRFYLIDFGLSREFKQEGAHMLCKRNVPFQGNMYWASNNVLKGLTASRRDDLESFMYVLIYLYRGDLPWYIGRERKVKVDVILRRKKAMTIDEMCSGLPSAFATVLTRIQSLTFPETPDYEGYRTAFREVFTSMGYTRDVGFDWKNRGGEDIAEVCLDDLEIVRSKGNSFDTEAGSEDEQDKEYDRTKRRASSSSPSKRTGRNRCPETDFRKPESPKLSLRKRLAALNTHSTKSPGLLMQQCNSSSSSSSSPTLLTPLTPLQHSGSLVLPRPEAGFRLRLIQVETEGLALPRSKTMKQREDGANADTPKGERPVMSPDVRKKYHRTLNL